MRRIRSGLAALAASAIVAACAGTAASPSATPAAPTGVSSPTAAPSSALEWSYAGATGPDHWAELDPSFDACGDGMQQSPMDLASPDEQREPDVEFGYRGGPATIVDDGRTILAMPTEPQTITTFQLETIDDVPQQAPTTSTLIDLRYHLPAEHLQTGRPPAVGEVQFLHEDDAGGLTAIAVWIERGDADDPAWAPYIDAMAAASTGEEPTATIDWSALIPPGSESFRYIGSLSTPPCTEGVRWVVMVDPIRLSDAQIQAMRDVHDQNARPIQTRGRTERMLTMDLRGE